MSEQAITPAFSDHGDPDMPPPIGIQPMAVLAFFIGIASSIALTSSLLWFIPGLGLLVSLLALKKTSSVSLSWSRRLALAGLVMSIMFAVWAPSQHYLRQWRITQQATVIGEQWIKLLLNGRADSAFIAQQYPANRPSGNEPLETLLMNDNQSKIQYERFLDSKLIRTLKHLGTRARIIGYKTEEMLTDKRADSITNIYAVTYLDGGERKSFFVQVVVERMDNPMKTTGVWRVKRFRGGVRPRGV